ncbi:MAG: DUF4332 domain-containing protein [Longimicrobiales bacterium]
MQIVEHAPVRPFVLARSDPRLRPAKLAVAAGFGVLVVSTIGMLRGVEPFATWYYQFAWYSVLLVADGALALRGAAGRGQKGEFLLLGRREHLISLLNWSIVVWLFYELLNFRLQNWHYVFVPENLVVRWLGTAVAFATVLPAVFLAEAFLGSFRFGEALRWQPLRVTRRFLTRMQVAGAVTMVLVLAWPRYFYPLVWGASMLLVEPRVYARARGRSLLADLEEGRPGRLLRLLAGGALIGLLWEMLNIGARAKWIYTVPFFEELKLFEMPVPGFLGFPPFAVECFVLWQALVCSGLAVPRWSERFPTSRGKRVTGVIGAAVFSVVTLFGMEKLTFASVRPELSDLPNVPVQELKRVGYDVFRLANADPSLVAAEVGAERASVVSWISAARLAALRGIGTEQLSILHQLDIRTVEQLANADAANLVQRLEQQTGVDWVDARVRVWVRGARRALQRLNIQQGAVTTAPD